MRKRPWCPQLDLLNMKGKQTLSKIRNWQGQIGGFLIRAKLALLACEMMHNIRPFSCDGTAAQAICILHQWPAACPPALMLDSCDQHDTARSCGLPRLGGLLVSFLASQICWQQGDQLPNNARRLKRKWSCNHSTAGRQVNLLVLPTTTNLLLSPLLVHMLVSLLILLSYVFICIPHS